MTLTFREAARRLSPARLLTAWARKFVYAFALPLDALETWMRQATRARFPESAPPDALPYLGRDRKIVRGPHESDASYRLRLLLWLESWRGAGVGRAMLDQLAGFLSPNVPRMRVITQRGVWYTREVDGTFTIERVGATDWDWDGDGSTLWARFWVVIYPPAGLWTVGPTWGDADLWGGAWGTAGYTWGSTATPNEVAGVRGIVRDWKPGGSKCVNIILAFDDATFDPGSPEPNDGLWGEPSKIVAGARVPSRLATARYWRGV